VGFQAAQLRGTFFAIHCEEISKYLTQALHRAMQQRPDRIASIFGTRQRSFREFGDRVARLAGALQKLGMKPGDRVAMLGLNSDRHLEYQMAVHRCMTP
jgi:acyl-CoA synthetase (AMP-forming)/AMP-acid ligase II